MSQRVIIVGPNLPRSLSDKGTFHVHAEGCADLRKGAIRPYACGEVPVECDSQIEIAEVVYDNGIMGEDETGADYLFDFHFAPCVTLPKGD